MKLVCFMLLPQNLIQIIVSNCLNKTYYFNFSFSEAHEQMATLDVLVCGQCHSAFHFVEDFKEHKDANNCTGKSPVRDSVSMLYLKKL